MRRTSHSRRRCSTSPPPDSARTDAEECGWSAWPNREPGQPAPAKRPLSVRLPWRTLFRLHRGVLKRHTRFVLEIHPFPLHHQRPLLDVSMDGTDVFAQNADRNQLNRTEEKNA